MKIWKQFRDYNYEVSSDGEVKNTLTGRILKQRQEKEGYLLIDIKIPSNNTLKNVNKTFRAHRIIAEVFLGSRVRGYEVDHINKIRNDNRCDNLRWIDKSKNAADRIRCGITKEEIEKIIEFHKNGDNLAKIYLKINGKIK